MSKVQDWAVPLPFTSFLLCIICANLARWFGQRCENMYWVFWRAEKYERVKREVYTQTSVVWPPGYHSLCPISRGCAGRRLPFWQSSTSFKTSWTPSAACKNKTYSLFEALDEKAAARQCKAANVAALLLATWVDLDAPKCRSRSFIACMKVAIYARCIPVFCEVC